MKIKINLNVSSAVNCLVNAKLINAPIWLIWGLFIKSVSEKALKMVVQQLEVYYY